MRKNNNNIFAYPDQERCTHSEPIDSLARHLTLVAEMRSHRKGYYWWAGGKPEPTFPSAHSVWPNGDQVSMAESVNATCNLNVCAFSAVFFCVVAGWLTGLVNKQRETKGVKSKTDR